jgi:hypothetical protein
MGSCGGLHDWHALAPESGHEAAMFSGWMIDGIAP